MKRHFKYFMFVLACIFMLTSCRKHKDNKDINDDGILTYTESGEGYILSDVSDKSIKSLDIPSKYSDKNVIGIKDGALNGCTELENINLPNTFTSISNDLFKDTKISYNEYQGGNYLGNSKDKYLYLMQYTASGDAETSINTRIIADNAFASKDITSISLNTGLYSISYRAFYGNDSLYSITLPSSLKVIEDEAFLGCDNLIEIFNLSSIELEKGTIKNGYAAYNARIISNQNGESNVFIENNFVYLKETTRKYLIRYTGSDKEPILNQTYELIIGKNAFASSIIEEITLPSNVEEIEDEAFKNAKNLKKVIIDGANQIGDNAFYGCESLTELVLGDKVDNVGINAFYGCNRLAYVYYKGDIEDWLSINFSYSEEQRYSNPMSYKPKFFLLDDTSASLVKNIALYDITEINEFGFMNFNDLESISLPNTLTKIGDYAFMGCEKLLSIEIPSGVESLEFGIFDGCTSLKELRIGINIKSVSNIFSQGMMLDNIYYASDDVSYSNIVFINMYCPLTYYTNNLYFYDGNEYYIPTRITLTAESISNFAFMNFKSITEVNITRNVKKIGSMCFLGCDNIEKIYYNGSIDDWCNITFSDYSSNPWHCGASLYIGGEKVIDVVLSTSNIKSYAFYNSDINTIILPINLTNIGYRAFYGCDKLVYVYYCGNSEEYGSISRSVGDDSRLDIVHIYYYSEEMPSSDEGYYWHYEEGSPQIW